MKKRVSLVFAAVLAMMLMIAGCQKEEEVAQVAAPSPEFVAWSESGLEDHVMDWKDENLAVAMSEYTGITDCEIMLSDVYELKEIKLNENTDVSPLKDLRIDYNPIKDISVLKNFKNLECLNIMSIEAKDTKVINKLKNLKQIYK